MARRMTEEYAKDLDETRLLYMALLRQRTEKYELAGTLVNALAHHQRVDNDVPDVIHHVLAVIEDADEVSSAWMEMQIARITGQL
jgi:hypothetical protein